MSELPQGTLRVFPVSDGHGVCLLTSRDDHFRRILEEIDGGHALSHRVISRQVGLSLGLTNQLLQQLVRQGFVRVIPHRANRRTYVLTARGLAERARVRRAHLETAVEYYLDARHRLARRLAAIPLEPSSRVVFYGAGPLAELTLLSLQGLDVAPQVVAVVDDGHTGDLFGIPVHPAGALAADAVNGTNFDHLIVTSCYRLDDIRRRLDEVGIQEDRITWL